MVVVVVRVAVADALRVLGVTVPVILHYFGLPNAGLHGGACAVELAATFSINIMITNASFSLQVRFTYIVIFNWPCVGLGCRSLRKRCRASGRNLVMGQLRPRFRPNRDSPSASNRPTLHLSKAGTLNITLRVPPGDPVVALVAAWSNAKSREATLESSRRREYSTLYNSVYCQT